MGKIGEGSAEAMLRQGLREVRNLVYPSSNVAQPAEMGVWGTATPQEVTESRRGDELVHTNSQEQTEPQDSILQSRVQQAQDRSTTGM